MTEETYRKWDIAVKVAAPIVTVAGIVIGVWQFSRDQSAQLERQYLLIAQNDRLEFKRKTWEKQLEVYTKIGEVVGRIAGADLSKDKLLREIEQFDTLYSGNMIFVEDAAVEQAMIAFHLDIGDFLKGIATKDKLKVRADMLIKACQASSKRGWFEQTSEPK
jgi:hypothetical protein